MNLQTHRTRRFFAVLAAVFVLLTFHTVCYAVEPAGEAASPGTHAESSLPTLPGGHTLPDFVGSCRTLGVIAYDDRTVTLWEVAISKDTPENRAQILSMFSSDDDVIIIGCLYNYRELQTYAAHICEHHPLTAEIREADTLYIEPLSVNDMRTHDEILVALRSDPALPDGIRYQVLSYAPSPDAPVNPEMKDPDAMQGNTASSPPPTTGELSSPPPVQPGSSESPYGKVEDKDNVGMVAADPQDDSKGVLRLGWLWILLLVVLIGSTAVAVRLRGRVPAYQTDLGMLTATENEAPRPQRRLSRRALKQQLRENAPAPRGEVLERIREMIDSD